MIRPDYFDDVQDSVGRPVEKLSTQLHGAPSSKSLSTRWLPIKPAPPVTMALFTLPSCNTVYPSLKIIDGIISILYFQ
jgi:hypothetical protein